MQWAYNAFRICMLLRSGIGPESLLPLRKLQAKDNNSEARLVFYPFCPFDSQDLVSVYLTWFASQSNFQSYQEAILKDYDFLDPCSTEQGVILSQKHSTPFTELWFCSFQHPLGKFGWNCVSLSTVSNCLSEYLQRQDAHRWVCGAADASPWVLRRQARVTGPVRRRVLEAPRQIFHRNHCTGKKPPELFHHPNINLTNGRPFSAWNCWHMYNSLIKSEYIPSLVAVLPPTGTIW